MDKEQLNRLQQARIPKPKKQKKRIAQKSAKRLAAEAAEKNKPEYPTTTVKQKFFIACRKLMTGSCGCGCGNKSSKYQNDYFMNSICHIFPQRLFPSVQFNLNNWIERAYWGGCHSNMDNRSMSLWPNFADWDLIKEKFYLLEPLLTEEERTEKFYHTLKQLVQNN